MTAASQDKISIPPSIFGVAAPILWSNTGRLLGIWDSHWMTGALVFLYLAIGFYIWRAPYKRPLGALFLVYLGTPIGVYLDFHIHRLVWDYDRGVWLFETVVFWMLVFVPLAAGAGIAKVSKHLIPRDVNKYR